LWVLAANLEVRAKRVDAARHILGMAVGMAPKDKTFKSYIDMELALGHVDR
jgi:crooked neck